MTVTEQDKQVIQGMYAAMQAGESGKENLIGLFAADATFVEPFNGPPQTHRGIDAIRARVNEMVRQPRPPDFLLKVDQVTTENGALVAYWTCTSDAMPGPMKGRDELKISDGRISFLKIEVTTMPGQPS
ncbi:MAG TPA: nuclear transport factor 2 family protein [Fimbriimonadaceae bacterium]|nr:nuclear transport factor 2 family protein [Fimbriimonadaceae bacterium]